MGWYLPAEKMNLEGEISVGLLRGKRFLYCSVVIAVWGDYTQFGGKEYLDIFQTLNSWTQLK